MRKRRFLAFALAALMLVCNTTTASATTAGPVNGSGDPVIVDGTNSDSEDESPDGTDGTNDGKDEEAGEDENTPEPDESATPGVQPSVTPGEGGSETSAPDTVQTPDPETTQTPDPEATETPEPDAEESDAGSTATATPSASPSASPDSELKKELLPTVSLLGTSGDETRDAGENVKLFYSIRDENDQITDGGTLYYSTIAEAVDKAGALSATYYYIYLLESEDENSPASFSVSGDDLVGESGYGWLHLNGQTVSVDAGESGTTARIANMGINNCDENSNKASVMGTLQIAKGTQLQILKPEGSSVGITLEDIQIKYAEEDSEATLIIGKQNAIEDENSITCLVSLSNVVLSENINMEIYDTFMFTPTENTKINSMKINMDEIQVTDGDSTHWSNEHVSIFGKLTVNDMTINNGSVNIHNISETKSELIVNNNVYLDGSLCPSGTFKVSGTCTVADGSQMMLGGETSIASLETVEGDSNNTYITIRDRSDVDEFGSLYVDEVKLHDSAKRIRINKDTGTDTDRFTEGEVIATVGNTVTPDMFSIGDMSINKVEDELIAGGKYLFSITTISASWEYQEVASVSSIEAAIDFIKNDTSEAARYEVALLDDIEISGGIDFSGIDKPVNISLRGHTMDVTDDIYVRAASLNSGSINVAKDKTVYLLSSGNTSSDIMQLIQTVFTFDEASTSGGLVIGEENATDLFMVQVYYNKNTYWGENTQFVNAGNVDLTIYGGLDYLSELDLEKLTGDISKEEFDKYLVSFNNIYIDSVFDNENKRNTYTNFGASVEANTLTVKGIMRAYSVNANAFEGYGKGQLTVESASTLGNITVEPYSDENRTDPFVISLNSIWQNGEAASEGTVTLSNSLTNNLSGPAISFRKNYYNIITNNDSTYKYLQYDNKRNGFEIGDVVATVPGTADSESGLITESNYLINSNRTPLVVGVEKTDDEGNYDLVALKDSNAIRVTIKKGDKWFDRGFDTLAEVKTYISNQSDPDKEYTIDLNVNAAVSEDELDYSSVIANRVALNLNGHNVTISNDAVIAVDNVDGRIFTWNEATNTSTESWSANSKFTLAGDKTLMVVPRNNEANNIVDVNGVTFVSNSTKPGSLILGNEELTNGSVVLENASFTNKWKNIYNYGQVSVSIYSSSSLTVSGTMFVKNNGYPASYTGYGNVNVTNLDASEGDLEVRNFKVTGTAKVAADRNFTVVSDGNAVFKNTVILPKEEDPYAYFRVELQRAETIVDESNTIKKALGKMTFTGTISADGMNDPIHVVKNVNTISFSPENSDEWNSEEFENGETVVTASNAAVTAKYFSIEGEGRCTRKVGTEIKADSVKLRVFHGEDGEPGIECRYSSLEDAAANLAEDFGSRAGEYSFTFCDDITLTKDVVIPSFVTSLDLTTDESSNGSGQYYVKHLDLNGMKLTTSAEVRLNRGLRIASNASARGQLILNAVSDGDDSFALHITEEVTLVTYNENDELVNVGKEDREPVLSNVLVTAKNGSVLLSSDLRDSERNIIPVSIDAEFNVKGFQIDSHWNLNGKLTVTGGTLGIYDATLVTGNPITVTNGKIEVMSGGQLYAKDITMSGAKLYNSDAYTKISGTLNVTKAYAGDTYGDATIENTYCGKILVNKLNMTDGTFAGDMESRTAVGSVSGVNNLKLGEESSFLCGTFNQQSSGKTYLGESAYVWIGTEGTVNNIALDGNAFLGRSDSAKLTLNGTFTRGDENQQLHCFVTNEKDMVRVGEQEEYSLSDIYASKNFTEAAFESYVEVPSLWDTTDPRYSNVKALEDGEYLFNTGITAFPVAYMHIWAWTTPASAENSEPKWTEENAVYQSGNQLLVTGKYITVSVLSADGNDAVELDSFTTWKEASAYLNTLSNTSATYIVSISKDLDINQKLALPGNVKKLILMGDGSPVRFTFEGDITLNTDTVFENMILDAYSVSKGNRTSKYSSTLDTKGKTLTLVNVSVDSEDGALKALKGTAATCIEMLDGSDIAVTTKMSGIGTLVLEGNSNIEVAGGLSVNNLVIDNADDVCSVKVTGDSKSALEVKNTLEMNAVVALYSDGTVKLNDVVSNAEGNNITTAKSNAVSIAGRVYTYDDDAMQTIDVKPVYTGEEPNKVLTEYRKVGESEDPTETYPVMQNAISLWVTTEPGPTAGTVLATAEKVSPVWFVVAKDAGTTDQYKDLTRKDGKSILCGANGKANVVLSAVIDSGDVVINTFDTLQEAFTEIDKIANAEAEFKLTLKADDTALKSGKITDYVFPAKAAKLTICSEASASDSTRMLTYNKSLALKSDVTFDNVYLCPSADGGTVALTNYTLELKKAGFTDETGTANTAKKFKITGGGIGKGSELVLTDCPDVTINSDISKVDRIVLHNTDLSVLGVAEIGNLVMEGAEKFAGRGKTTVGNVYSDNNSASIITTPKLTKDKAGKITKTEPTLTVSGEIRGSVQVKLLNTDGTDLSLTDAGLSALAEGNGIPFAKAAKANPELVLISGWVENGHVYKKSGVFVIKTTEPQVKLSYTMESGQVEALYETFADAVTEINTLKTKRDYTITFIETNEQKPVILTMPKAGCADTLTLSADEDVDVYYEKDITFNSNVVLDDIHFVQVAKNKRGIYEEISAVKAAENKYADPVKVTVSGAYELSVDGTVTFNTPIALSGSKKATLTLDGDGRLLAGSDLSDAPGVTYIEGSITNFAKVNVDTDIQAAGYPTGALNAAQPAYMSAEFTVTDLNISGSLVTYGNAELKNVVLSKNAVIDVRGKKFNITGNVTSTTTNATLKTVIDSSGSKSVLNISGNVILEKPENMITVCVFDVNGDYVRLGDTYTDENGVEKTNSNKLLTAKNADINAFLVDLACLKVESAVRYSESYTNGYILKKSGSDILVYYGDEVEAALYSGGELYNYYISFNEAVAAIDALNDKTAEYEIKLLQNVGSETSYEKINMPTKAANVKITSLNNKAVYYSNDITLGCDTAFEEVKLVPAVSNKVKKGISVKGYELTLYRILTDGLGKITGDNKTSKVTITVYNNDDVIIDGDITNIADMVLYGATSPAKVQVKGKMTVGNLIFADSTSNLEVLGKGSSVKNIRNDSDIQSNSTLSFNSLSITESITVKHKDSNIELNNLSVSQAAQYDRKNPAKLVLNDSCKLVSIPKVIFNNVSFEKGGESVRAAWSGKAVYYLDDSYENGVTVYAEDGTTSLADCVDLTQAAAYIEMLANKDGAYIINVPGDITDTSVTDTNAVSKLTLPKKDSAKSVVVDGDIYCDESYMSNISFTGDITANGAVEFKDIVLRNNADFSIKNVKNSDNKKENLQGAAKVTLTNVIVDTEDRNVGYVKSITGEKNFTVLTLNNTILITTAKSDVATLELVSGGSWAALGATTIGTVDNSQQDDRAFLGTYLNKGVPQMTIAGNVSKTVKTKLYDFATRKEISEVDETKPEQQLYENQPLITAKSESADKFVASPFAEWSEITQEQLFVEGVKAYKNKSNYVYNGDIADMDVLLESGGTQTYVKTYTEAIQIINNIGDKNAEYTITLRNTANNEGIIKTAVDGKMNAVYGALALPQAGKAAKLTIAGDTEDAEVDQLQLHYTGKLEPKCDLTFENVVLTEGTTKTVNKVAVFTPTNSITPNYSGVTVTFGNNVRTLDAAAPADFAIDGETGPASPDIVFSSVTVKNSGKLKGVLDISGHNVYVNGAVSAADIQLQGFAGLYSKAKITLDNILGNGYLLVATSYTDKAFKSAVTQFTINGEMSSDVILEIMQYVCETNPDKTKSYVPLSQSQAEELLYHGEGKPAAWQKLITAPKLQIGGNGEGDYRFVLVNYGGTHNTVKYDGGVYVTDLRTSINVVGRDSSDMKQYEGRFLTWDQAVKEIDKLDHGNDKSGNGGWSYTITLRHDIGTDGAPLGSLTLPAKAAKVTIESEQKGWSPESGTVVNGIITTSTVISLKTDLEIAVPIVAVKKSGNNYYDVPYTLNVGNYNLVLDEIPADSYFENMGQYESRMKLAGNTKGTITVNPYTDGDNKYSSGIEQISNVGKMTINRAEDYTFDVVDGITGVGELILKPGIAVNSTKDVSVKNLTMGGSVPPVESNYVRNELESGVAAKNITVSDTLNMASAWLKAGTSAIGDGKVTLNNVVLEDNYNSMEGKQDAKGVSQIQIKGTVSAQGESIIERDAAVTIGLYYNNSSQKYVQLTDGMTLLTAPKAASSWFIPNYAWTDDRGTPEDQGDDVYYANMGPEIGADICKFDGDGNPVFDEEEESKSLATEWIPTYGTYKSGNAVKYGKLREVFEYDYVDAESRTWRISDIAETAEARLWIGSESPDEGTSIDFMTFEEAVKAIDSMGNVRKYCIELLNDVEMGNEKKDNKYSALSLPSKASDVIIWGNGREISFTGNITLRCNTAFKDVRLMPLKVVKGEAKAQPAKINIAAGNFILTWEYSEMADEEENTCINNITGSSKSGELKVMYDSWLEANSIFGFKKITFSSNGDGNPAENEETLYGQILTDGSVTAKEISYEDKSAGILEVHGNLTTDSIYVGENADAKILCLADKAITVNGSVAANGSDKVKVTIVSPDSGNILPGTRLINGKYLDEKDWEIFILKQTEGMREIPYSAYVTGNALLLGSEITVD